MSVKKLLILAAAGVASFGATAAAIAGGPDQMAPPPPAESYFYVEGSIGYAYQNWDNNAVTAIGPFVVAPIGAPAIAQGDGVSGGLTYGGDIGYMFNQNFGLELGWTYLPRFVSLTLVPPAAFTAAPGQAALQSTWGAWAVVKAALPLTDNLGLFFKTGLGYRYGKITFGGMPNAKMRELRPIFALGGSYSFMETWMASLQWMHFMGGTTYGSSLPAVATAVSVTAPSSDVFTFSIGYKFMV